MNVVILSGRLVADPQVKAIGNDNMVAEFRVAVDRKWAKDGAQSADFIQCKMYGTSRAEFIKKYFQKGKPIEIVGSLHIDVIKREGDTYDNYTYVRVDEVGFVLTDGKGSASPDENDSTEQEETSVTETKQTTFAGQKRHPAGTGASRRKLGL